MSAISPAATPPRGPIVRAAESLDWLLGKIELAFLWAACGCTAVMLVINIANLIVRNFTGRGIVWVWAWTGVLFVWAVFLALFVLYRRKLDVSMDFFLERLPAGIQRGVRVLTGLCGMAMMALIVIETPQIFIRQVGVIDFVGLERYVLSIPLIAASAMIVLHFMADIVLTFTGHRTAVKEQEVPKWSL